MRHDINGRALGPAIPMRAQGDNQPPHSRVARLERWRRELRTALRTVSPDADRLSPPAPEDRWVIVAGTELVILLEIDALIRDGRALTLRGPVNETLNENNERSAAFYMTAIRPASPLETALWRQAVAARSIADKVTKLVQDIGAGGWLPVTEENPQ